jgi:hypothetical protein
MSEKRERRPHYECNHKSTVCRDCDGSPMPSSPWVTSVSRVRKEGGA